MEKVEISEIGNSQSHCHFGCVGGTRILGNVILQTLTDLVVADWKGYSDTYFVYMSMTTKIHLVFPLGRGPIKLMAIS